MMLQKAGGELANLLEKTNISAAAYNCQKGLWLLNLVSSSQPRKVLGQGRRFFLSTLSASLTVTRSSLLCCLVLAAAGGGASAAFSGWTQQQQQPWRRQQQQQQLTRSRLDGWILGGKFVFQTHCQQRQRQRVPCCRAPLSPGINFKFWTLLNSNNCRVVECEEGKENENSTSDDCTTTTRGTTMMNGDPEPEQSERKSREQVLYSFGFPQHVHNDLEEMPVPTRALKENHAIFGTLMSQPEVLVKLYRVFRHLDNNNDNNDNNLPVVTALIQLGPKLNGHDGIVHGGILALLIDDVVGFSYEALDIPMAVTANLNVNFRQPLAPYTRFLIQTFLVQRTERKLVFSFRVTSATTLTSTSANDDTDGTQPILYCEGTSVYVIPKQYVNTIPNEDGNPRHQKLPSSPTDQQSKL